MTNPVVHFEIQTDEPEQVQRFFADAFGWNVDANNPMEYGMVPAGEGGIGGGIAGNMGGGNLVTFYIQVDDIDAQLEKIERLGGKTIQPKMEIPDGPTIALFADPQGNTVGLVSGM
jgi:predicted enzyme related to lactoylglutathione lyase